jgi:hypothetical protein
MPPPQHTLSSTDVSYIICEDYADALADDRNRRRDKNRTEGQ